MKTLRIITASVALFAFPALASAASDTGYCATATAICSVANTILGLINGVLVPVLFALAFIVFIYGIAKAYIFSGGDATAVSDGHRLILWGIIGFVVMISLWGIVNVVSSTFGLSGSGYTPDLPQSPTS